MLKFVIAGSMANTITLKMSGEWAHGTLFLYGDDSRIDCSTQLQNNLKPLLQWKGLSLNTGLPPCHPVL